MRWDKIEMRLIYIVRSEFGFYKVNVFFYMELESRKDDCEVGRVVFVLFIYLVVFKEEEEIVCSEDRSVSYGIILCSKYYNKKE